MTPAEGTVFTGFALTLVADFLRTVPQALVVAVRVLGTVVALVGVLTIVL